MKKTLKNTGALTKDGVDYLAKFRKANESEIKRSSLAELIQKVEESRAQKLKKAS
jgi:hypothetical protein